jgi:hypothetical protein
MVDDCVRSVNSVRSVSAIARLRESRTFTDRSPLLLDQAMVRQPAAG